MPQVLAWKSAQDGKLFEDKALYRKHLRKLAGVRAQDRRLKKMADEREAFFDRMGQTVKSIEELEQFVQDNWQFFFNNGLAENTWRMTRPGAEPKHQLVKIEFRNIRWSDSVSNTHSCPRNGVQNWAQSANRRKGLNLPEGYPGWLGQIYFSVDAGVTNHKVPLRRDGWSSDYFRHTPINTGSGNGGSECSYEVRLYAADFPAMALAHERAQVWNTLSEGKARVEFA